MDDEKKIVLDPSARDAEMQPAKPKDYFIFTSIGLLISLLNISINVEYRNRLVGDNWEEIIWGYLIIIFLVIIPAVIFGLMKRPRGYAYIIGYFFGGLIEFILPMGDKWIGGYTMIVSLMLFTVIILIFKIWRSLSKMKLG